MYSIIKRSDDIGYNVNEYVCETKEDLDSLPNCEPGSIAIVLQNKNTIVYMKSSSDKWV